ncbi:MAG: hypothetical protein NTY32_00630 [Bacteroidia bacterium]|nr:hypothetical protein [Bacteroidia bacterium]
MIDQKSPMYQNASEEFQFLRVGKELPYKVPEGFFDELPERTLQKVKIRLESRKRKLHFTSAFVAFAAAAAILAFVFLLPNRALTLEDRLIAKGKPMETKPEVTAKSFQPNGVIVPKQVASVKNTIVASDEENLDDILKSLSEEDLSDLLADYKTDDFEEALSTETSNFN